MARGDRLCQEPGGALGRLARFRQELRWCLWRRGDALMELADAVLTAPHAGTLPYLSLEPCFRRSHGMVYQALSEGGIDEEALRDLLVAAREPGWAPVFAIDASTYPRPWAGTSPGREFHHHSCHGGDGTVKGWAFQWLSQVSLSRDSWTAPQDQVRVGARDDATRQAAQQVIAHSGRLRAAGEDRVPLYLLDAGYDEAPLTWDLHRHLDRVQILVRLRNDRVLYRDPPPRVPGRPGRFECAGSGTWGAPDQELSLHDGAYGQVSVMSWGGLHPKLRCRGRFAWLGMPPVIKCHLIRVTVTRLPGGRKVPGPLWLWRAGPGEPDLDLLWRSYLHRFRRGARPPVRQARPGLGQGRAPLPRAGLPLDLDHHRRPDHAPPGPAPGRRPPPALGTAPQPAQAHPRPGPPRFRPPGRARRHPGQRAKTLPGRPRTTQRPPRHPRHPLSRPQENSTTSRHWLKRKRLALARILWSVAAGDHGAGRACVPPGSRVTRRLHHGRP
jgi:hypothetical protein